MRVLSGLGGVALWQVRQLTSRLHCDIVTSLCHLVTPKNILSKEKGNAIGLEPWVIKNLKLLAAEKETTIQAILGWLVREYFKKHNKVRG